jgi:hypothetical protein
MRFFNYWIGKKEFKLQVFIKIISSLGNSENLFNVNKYLTVYSKFPNYKIYEGYS